MARPLRSRLMLLATMLSVLSLVAIGAAGQARAADAQCGTSSESRQPVLLVHGYNSGPQTWNADTRKKFASVSGTCIDVFDYKNWSTHWVTDSHIGPALATRITQLSTASAAAGGSGKVIIVAHSMGGLASRCALAESCNGNKSGVAGRVMAIITFGTPNTGTWLRGRGVGDGVVGGAASLLSGACYTSFHGANPICEQIRALFTSSATKAFTPDSKQLMDLPPTPSEIPVFAVAAHVEAVTSLFGWQSVDIGDAGDVIVKENSALVEGVRYGKVGGGQTIACGKINVLRLSGENCNHVTETNDSRFLDAAIKQIKLAVHEPPRKNVQPTSPEAALPGRFEVDYAAPDGSRVAVTFALAHMVAAGDPSVAALFPAGAPCEADATRDAVFAGTLTIVNQTPDFTPDFRMAIVTPQPAPGNQPTLSFGIGYGNDPTCQDINGEYGGYGVMKPAVSPNMIGAQWGPVNVEFVVHNVFTPSVPAGDPGIVGVNLPVLSAFQKGGANMYSITATPHGAFTPGASIGGTNQMIGLNLSSIVK